MTQVLLMQLGGGDVAGARRLVVEDLRSPAQAIPSRPARLAAAVYRLGGGVSVPGGHRGLQHRRGPESGPGRFDSCPPPRTSFGGKCRCMS